MRRKKSSAKMSGQYAPPKLSLKDRVEEARRDLATILRHPLESASIISVMVAYIAFYFVSLRCFTSGTMRLADWASFLLLALPLFIPAYTFLGWTLVLPWYVDLVSIEYLDNIRTVGRGGIVVAFIEALLAVAFIYDSPPETFDPHSVLLLIAFSQCAAAISCLLDCDGRSLRIPRMIFVCASLISLAATVGPLLLS